MPGRDNPKDESGAKPPPPPGKKSTTRKVAGRPAISLACPNCSKPWGGPAPNPGDLIFCASCGASIPVPRTAAQPAPKPAQEKSAPAAAKEGSGPVTLVCTGCGRKSEVPSYAPGDILFCDKCNSSLALEKKTALGKVLGKYAIDSELGRGGMAVVYKATQQGLNRPVALKVLLAAEDADLPSITALQAEAQSAAGLRHPNIVTVLDVGEFKGLHYIAMDLIEGKPLSSLLGKRRFKGKAAATIMAKLGRAVHYAHDQGLIHRDIKPSNILLEKGDEPKLMDFGLARSTDAGKKKKGAEGISGTPSYMPPEQARNEKNEDRRSDVYSLGAVLYALLTGAAPFSKAGVRETLEAVLGEDLKPPREINASIPRELEAICLKAMAREREERYPSAQAFSEDLERYLKDMPIQALPSGPLTSLLKTAKRNPLLFGGLGAAAAILAFAALAIAFGSGGATGRRSDSDKQDQAEKAQIAEEKKKEEARRRWEEDYERNKKTVLDRVEVVKEKTRNMIARSRTEAASDPDLALRTLEEAEILIRELADKALEDASRDHLDRLMEDPQVTEAVISKHDIAAIEAARASARGARAFRIWTTTLDLESARAEYNIAVQASPDDATLLMGRGIVFSEAGLWREAYIDFKRVMEKKPESFKSPENLRCFMDAAARAGVPEDVDSHILELPDAGPDRPYFRGLSLMAAGNMKAAREEFAKAIKTNNMDPRAHLANAEAAHQEGKSAEAANMLTLVIAVAKNMLNSAQTAQDARANFNQKRPLFEALLLRARIRFELSRSKNGEEQAELLRSVRNDLDEAMAINPSDARPKKLLNLMIGG